MVFLKEIDKENDPKRTITEKLNEYTEKTGRNGMGYYSNFLTADYDINSIDSIDKTGFMNVVEELDKNKGLDLFLHTPGGSMSSTEEIIKYLESTFDGDVRAIVPQISMSGGTMIACGCKEILMGNYSNLGPVDPQIFGLSAKRVIKEFNEAKKDLSENPELEAYYKITLGKYTPNFKFDCEETIKWCENILETSLKNGMFKNDAEKIDKVKKALITSDFTKNHSQPLSRDQCQKIGLKITPIEKDKELEELILSIHYAFMSLFNRQKISKLIINQNGTHFFTKSKFDWNYCF